MSFQAYPQFQAGSGQRPSKAKASLAEHREGIDPAEHAGDGSAGIPGGPEPPWGFKPNSSEIRRMLHLLPFSALVLNALFSSISVPFLPKKKKGEQSKC